jgi:hypothetical protein
LAGRYSSLELFAEFAMNNGDEELTHLEQTIVDHAKKRYRRHVFRYGHLLGWLLVPAAAVLFVPAMHPYQHGLSLFILVALLLSQAFTSTRIIGKLATTVDRDRNIELEIPPRKTGFPLKSRPGLLFSILLFPVILLWVRLTGTHWSFDSVGEAIAVEAGLEFYIAIFALLAGIVGCLCTRNHPFYSKSMSFGAELALCFGALIAIAWVLGLGHS